MNNIKFNLLYDCYIIIYKIDNNLLLFINDYKLELIKNLKEVNKEDPTFILTLNNNDLKNFCIDLINKIIK